MTDGPQQSVKPPRHTPDPLKGNPRYAAALGYARRGWSVFALLPKRKSPFEGSHGFKDATTDGGMVRHWWGLTPEANVGIATGAVSGLFVVDVDRRHGGDKTLARQEREHGPLPRTITARTGGRGRHIYFRHPGGGLKVVCRQNALGQGVDVKGDGGYVVAPPSTHPNGTVYAWEVPPDTVDLADAPAWLIVRVTERTERTEAISVSLCLCNNCGRSHRANPAEGRRSTKRRCFPLRTSAQGAAGLSGQECHRLDSDSETLAQGGPACDWNQAVR